ncbi:MAG: adenosylcobalamin-dependent ribonucleoside-diphosphate reductase [Rhizobiales bacterium]|nr:adenosylcobalamin-dependent ribonucleoside-diphosphate reductase [Hyphomicrobiales bacterium]
MDLPQISHDIWAQKYRLTSAIDGRQEGSIGETHERVAGAVARAEAPGVRVYWRGRFREALERFEFLPGGRILAGAGSGRRVTLFNCFVMGTIADDMAAIFEAVKEAALTMQAGGGIGQDFSTLRPSGSLVEGVGADASGPIGFMDVWDAMCRTIMSAGARRGAMMGTLRCDHPDIEAFVDVKADPARLRMFNLSVLVSDAFVAAVREDRDWDLVFDGRVYRTVSARALWDRIMRANHAYAEPGVIFIDRINEENNLGYCETITATNPCGEQPLPPYGACLLGSINLAALVREPFEAGARLDEGRLDELTETAVRFLDDVIDVSAYPLAVQRLEARQKRRIGLGVTGLADALVLLGLRYDSQSGRETAARWMARLQNAAYRASAHLASEKGTFPLYDRESIMARPGVGRLSGETRDLIARHGLRNGLLTSIAPTGTISLLAGNVSSGIEPIFRLSYARRLRESGDRVRVEHVEDHAYRVWRLGGRAGRQPALAGATAEGAAGEGVPAKGVASEIAGGSGRPGQRHVGVSKAGASELPAAFVTAEELSPRDHLAMQAALQPHVDSAISKTINCPRAIDFADFKDIYLTAHASGLKGCTTFRPNEVTGSVLFAEECGAPGLAAKDAGPPARAAAGPRRGTRKVGARGRGPSHSAGGAMATLAAEASPSRSAGRPAIGAAVDEGGGRLDEACPECRGAGFMSRDGCGFCPDCGYSRCG